MTMDIVIAGSPGQGMDAWRAAFAAAMPQARFHPWRDDGPRLGARYAIVWKPPAALFERETGLQAVFNLGAGVDALMGMPQLPSHVAVLRLEDAGMAVQMVEYVLYGLLRASRGFDRYAAQQRQGLWAPLPAVDRSRWPVGVMGLGVLGARVAQAVAGLGYPVAGWARGARELAGVEVYAGGAQLPGFLARSRVLVNMLPLTPQTEGILDRANLGRLQPGGYLINVARGGHLVEADLLALLDEGRMDGALLDVFHDEPLPPGHPFWQHPRVIVTPHVAAATLQAEAVAQIADKILAMESGRRPPAAARERGY
jgi:glyoxylate/hydroxypyruvate reductase A